MRALKNILINLGFLALLFAVMLVPANAEGQLGNCSLEAGAFGLSLTMTIVSALAYGTVGNRSMLAMRCISGVVVLWFLLSVVLFTVFEKPDLVGDIAKYWVGAILSPVLVALQGLYNRRNFTLLFRGRNP